MSAKPPSFWERAAISIACAIVRNAGADVLHQLDAATVANVADKMEAERVRRLAGSKPS